MAVHRTIICLVYLSLYNFNPRLFLNKTDFILFFNFQNDVDIIHRMSGWIGDNLCFIGGIETGQLSGLSLPPGDPSRAVRNTVSDQLRIVGIRLVANSVAVIFSLAGFFLRGLIRNPKRAGC